MVAAGRVDDLFPTTLVPPHFVIATFRVTPDKGKPYLIDEPG